MGIEKLVYNGVNSIADVAKKVALKPSVVTGVIEGGEKRIASTLDALATQGAALVEKSSQKSDLYSLSIADFLRKIFNTNVESLDEAQIQKLKKALIDRQEEIELLNIEDLRYWNDGFKDICNQIRSDRVQNRLSSIWQAGEELIPVEHELDYSRLKRLESTGLVRFTNGMRGFCQYGAQKTFGDSESEDFWKVAKAFDGLFEKQKPLAQECVVYRGLNTSLGEEMNLEFIRSLKAGDIIDHKTYVATAARPTDYTNSFVRKTSEYSRIMRIKLPPGTKGLLLNDELDEFVLPRNSKIKINSIDKNGLLDCEYILPQN